jgi:hypothetical protein|tara:strand:+ start:141 stop:245 length:105 start_codon:yes stop_codon:yes gene_type:complete
MEEWLFTGDQLSIDAVIFIFKLCIIKAVIEVADD